MIFGIKRRSDILGLIAAACIFFASLNALEYFFRSKDSLAKYEGIITDVNFSYYQVSSRNRGYYIQTLIRLKDYKRVFRLKERSNDIEFLPLQNGDTVKLYVKRWYQYIYLWNFSTNVYYIEKNGSRFYNNFHVLKSRAFSIMCFMGGLGFFLFIIFLDQSKNISIEIWYQRRILKNRDYRRK